MLEAGDGPDLDLETLGVGATEGDEAFETALVEREGTPATPVADAEGSVPFFERHETIVTLRDREVTVPYPRVNPAYLVARRTDDADPDTEHRTVLGVDLGVNNIAVTSTGTLWAADAFNHWRRECETRRGSLQQTGTRAAREAIDGVGRKEYGRSKICLHGVGTNSSRRPSNTAVRMSSSNS